MLRLTRAQVREIDRRSIEEYHIPGIVLMENAARAVADLAWKMIGQRPGFVSIVCGGGNNGGDGLAVARHVHNLGAKVQIVLAVDSARYTGDALSNLRIAKAMKLAMVGTDDARCDEDLLIDALFGTGLSQPPRDDFGKVIDRMNRSGRILAVDLPSGLDCDTGQPLGASCIRAAKTVTFVAEKAGFANPAAKQFTGEVIVGDIGCPRELIEEVAREAR